MGHLSVYRRMLVSGIGTLIATVGAMKTFVFPDMSFPLYMFLFVTGSVVLVINEVIFGLRKEQLEIDRDEKIKGSGEKLPHSPTILAICPQCKSRIPSDSKYCLECGTNLQRQTDLQ